MFRYRYGATDLELYTANEAIARFSGDDKYNINEIVKVLKKLTREYEAQVIYTRPRDIYIYTIQKQNISNLELILVIWIRY